MSNEYKQSMYRNIAEEMFEIGRYGTRLHEFGVRLDKFGAMWSMSNIEGISENIHKDQRGFSIFVSYFIDEDGVHFGLMYDDENGNEDEFYLADESVKTIQDMTEWVEKRVELMADRWRRF